MFHFLLILISFLLKNFHSNWQYNRDKTYKGWNICIILPGTADTNVLVRSRYKRIMPSESV